MSVIHAPKEPTLDSRVLLLPTVVGLSLLTIFLRLWYIQVVKASELAERASYYRNTLVAKLAPRGLIYDRNNEVLAGIQSRFVLTAVPAVVNKNPWVLEKAAKLLNADESKLQEKVDAGAWKPYIPTTIFVGVPIEVASRIAEAGEDLPGLGVESQPMRYYPDSKAFSDVLGYVWSPNEKDVERLSKQNLKPAEYVGKTGIEYQYEQELMGAPGADHLEVDAKRRPMRVVGRDNPTPGGQLILGLDANLQKLALQMLQGKVGAAVAIDPRNGDVLCLASSPAYDSSLFANGISAKDWEMLRDDPDKPLLNRAISASYAPGSTFKLITSLAAERTGKFDVHRTTYCPGYYMVGKRKSKCMSAHGSISYHDALEKSCNTYFSALGMDVGEDAIRQAAVDCGLNDRTGIDIRSEAHGVIPTEAWLEKHRKPPKWYAGDTVNLSIGQGEVAATPLQMANLAALVGSEGVQYKPHLLKAIRHSDGKVEQIQPSISHRVTASAFFWREIKSAMTDVVERGTATRAKIQGLAWAAKTGSAEHGRKGQQQTHGWFVGFAPVDNPQIAVCVLVEEGGHGGEVCAPIAAALVKRYFEGKAAPKAAAAAVAMEARSGNLALR